DVAISPTTREIFVSDPAAVRVQVFDRDFNYLRQYPIYAYSLNIDPSGTYLYVTMYPGYIGKHLASDGSLVKQWLYYVDERTFRTWGFATALSGNIYIGDLVHDRACKYSSTGALVFCWGDLGTADGEFSEPGSVAVNPTE